MRRREVVTGLRAQHPGKRLTHLQSFPSTLVHAKEEAIAELNSNKNSTAGLLLDLRRAPITIVKWALTEERRGDGVVKIYQNFAANRF